MTDLTLKAPLGKFRVVGVDTFDRTDWVEGDFDTLAEAVSRARAVGGTMLKTHVYNDRGQHMTGTGEF